MTVIFRDLAVSRVRQLSSDLAKARAGVGMETDVPMTEGGAQDENTADAFIQVLNFPSAFMSPHGSSLLGSSGCV